MVTLTGGCPQRKGQSEATSQVKDQRLKVQKGWGDPSKVTQLAAPRTLLTTAPAWLRAFKRKPESPTSVSLCVSLSLSLCPHFCFRPSARHPASRALQHCPQEACLPAPCPQPCQAGAKIQVFNSLPGGVAQPWAMVGSGATRLLTGPPWRETQLGADSIPTQRTPRPPPGLGPRR